MKTNRIRRAAATVLGGLLLCGSALAVAATVPEPFQGSDENATYALSYENLDTLLEAVAVDMGPSNREKAPREKMTTGTRLKVKVNRYTMNEGNRFYFETFVDNEKAIQQLEAIKQGIEGATSQVNLKRFSRDEQLAYWLNLYNITILSELVKIYPQRDLEKTLFGKNSILDKKTLVVEGVPLSLNDIQHTILAENYADNPLVIYGLYQGIIGSPNIRKRAYTGKSVHDALTDNAVVFINSNRGTAIKNAKKFRVSSFYERNAAFFPNFETDLKAHLTKYLEGEEHAALATATSLKADINDWTVTDLGGSYREVGGSLANNNAAMMGSVQGASSSNFGMSASTVGGTSGVNTALARQAQENNKNSDDDEDEATDSEEEETEK